jgi:DNA-binding GntR family transcriptional regulator
VPKPSKTAWTSVGRSDSLRQKIYLELRARLQRGEVDADERLIDVNIAQAMGVSRMPVREALLQLANEGYLVGTTRGFALPKLSWDDITDIFEVRKLLEPRAAANAARDLTAEGDVALRRAARRAQAAHKKNDFLELSLANVEFRETWLAAVRNERLAATISRFADHVQIVRFATLHDTTTQSVVVGGLKNLLDAFIRRDPVRAQDEMSVFIAEAEKSFFKSYQDNPLAPPQTARAS